MRSKPPIREIRFDEPHISVHISSEASFLGERSGLFKDIRLTVTPIGILKHIPIRSQIRVKSIITKEIRGFDHVKMGIYMVGPIIPISI